MELPGWLGKQASKQGVSAEPSDDRTAVCTAWRGRGPEKELGEARSRRAFQLLTRHTPMEHFLHAAAVLDPGNTVQRNIKLCPRVVSMLVGGRQLMNKLIR